jgi:hypothetical protein
VDVTWESSAERLLQQRDRFTQQAIKREFQTLAEAPAPPPRSIEFDAARKGYLTSVAEERFTVVWYLDNGTAVVRAVVPTTRFSPESPDLKSRVQDIVKQESRGAVDVK